jgi:hypothetical protein
MKGKLIVMNLASIKPMKVLAYVLTIAIFITKTFYPEIPIFIVATPILYYMLISSRDNQWWHFAIEGGLFVLLVIFILIPFVQAFLLWPLMLAMLIYVVVSVMIDLLE